MGKSLVVSLMGTLLSASVAWCQAPDGSSIVVWSRPGIAKGEAPAPTQSAQLPVPMETPILPTELDHEAIACPIEPVVRSRSILSAEADYLLWIYPNRVASSSVGSTAITPQVPLGTLGDERFSRHVRSGGQFALGWWETEVDAVPTRILRSFGAEVRFFFLPERSLEFAHDASPSIFRPFFDLNNRAESGVVVASPGLATGGIEAIARERFWGAEVNLWKNVYNDDIPNNMVSFDMMAGFRHLGLEQDIEFGRSSVFSGNLAKFPQFAGFENNRIREAESFSTRNYFYGAQIGVNGNLFLDRVILTASAKLALGTTHEELEINGIQLRTLANGTTTAANGALLALPSNIGSHERNHFAQVPEFGLKATCAVFDGLAFNVGVTSLYWNRYARASDQIQRAIDITQIPSFPGAAAATPTATPRPDVTFTQASLWVIGVNFGVEFSW